MFKLIRAYLRFLTPSIFGIDDMFMATAGPLVAGCCNTTRRTRRRMPTLRA